MPWVDRISTERAVQFGGIDENGNPAKRRSAAHLGKQAVSEVIRPNHLSSDRITGHPSLPKTFAALRRIDSQVGLPRLHYHRVSSAAAYWARMLQ
jgi:hypothetical protein